MFKKIIIVILILLFVGVLSIQFTVNTEVSEIEEEEEETEEVEGFSFDNKNVIVEEIRGIRKINQELKRKKMQEKIEADKKKQEKQRKARLEKQEKDRKKKEQEAARDRAIKEKIRKDVEAKKNSALITSINNSEKETGKPVVISGGSFIKLQGKVQELQGDLYDLKNEINTKNAALNARISNTVQKDQIEKKFNEYEQNNKRILETSEKRQDNKIKSIYLDNKVDKLEDKKKDNAEAKAIDDNFSKYLSFW